MKYLFLFLCLGMFACSGSRQLPEINGVVLNLVELNGNKVVLTESEEEKAISIVFNTEESKVNGKSACNTYFGGFELDGAKLKFLPMGATRMMCPDLTIEQEYFVTLDSVDSYKLDEKHLSLLKEDKVVALFEIIKQ